MNRCKKIRSTLKGQGINPNETTYIGVTNFNNSQTIKLNPKCGRAIYKNLKRGVQQ